MKYLFYDVETTGLSKASDILSLAVISCDSQMCIQEVYNEYFLYGDAVPSGAVAVHGLTQQKLEFLGNREFMLAAQDIYRIFSQPNITLVGHNILKYDNRVMQHNLAINGFVLDFETIPAVDTLVLARKHLAGSHNLEACVRTLAEKIGKSQQFVNELFDNAAAICEKVVDKDSRYHSALYDSFCTYFIYFVMRSYGLN